MLLIGFCEELGIGSVLTTEVINWARSSVREIDLARRLARWAVRRGTPPKHIDDRLAMLRDPELHASTPEQIRDLAQRITDPNVRLFADHETDRVHGLNRDVHAADEDPGLVFDALGITEPSHAFYLGWEMSKAWIALTLGKTYRQDEALQWGLMTRSESSGYERRQEQKRQQRRAKREEDGAEHAGD
jgi:dihydropteroate synthase